MDEKEIIELARWATHADYVCVELRGGRVSFAAYEAPDNPGESPVGGEISFPGGCDRLKELIGIVANV